MTTIAAQAAARKAMVAMAAIMVSSFFTVPTDTFDFGAAIPLNERVFVFCSLFVKSLIVIATHLSVR